MSEIMQQTLIDLQLPTMSLVEKFCETPEEVKSFFAGMTAVYENDPTADNIRRIADKIKSRDSREQKQDWLRQELKQVSATARENAVEKYIKQKNAVPAGLPCSGDLLTYLDYVPRQAKDELLEAQAGRPDFIPLKRRQKRPERNRYRYRPGRHAERSQGVFEQAVRHQHSANGANCRFPLRLSKQRKTNKPQPNAR